MNPVGLWGITVYTGINVVSRSAEVLEVPAMYVSSPYKMAHNRCRPDFGAKLASL